jgi:hypothetical protein
VQIADLLITPAKLLSQIATVERVIVIGHEEVDPDRIQHTSIRHESRGMPFEHVKVITGHDFLVVARRLAAA